MCRGAKTGGLDFAPLLGTGAGTVAHEMTEMEFSRMGKQTRITTDLPALDRFRADEVLEPRPTDCQ